MTDFRLIVGFVCAAMLLAGREAWASGELKIKPSEDFVHRVSGFKFAAQVGDFHRISVYQFDEKGLDISVGYRNDDKHITITTYVYACKLREHGANLEKEFSLCEQGIRAKHEGLKVIEVGPTKLEQGEQAFSGKKGVYSLENFGQTGEKAISQLYPFVHGTNFIEFRITCRPGDEQPAEPAIANFFKTLKWP